MISTTQGYQFNNFFFLGGGLGLLRYIDGKKTMMPIFAGISINLLNNRAVLKGNYTLAPFEFMIIKNFNGDVDNI